MYYTQLLTFVEETYNIDGVIGVDNELNLVSEYVIDSNKISEYIQGSGTGSDDDIFMVQYDSDTMSATKGEYFPGTNVNSRYYNEQLLNSSVVQRFDYLGEFALSLGNLDALFRVSNTVGAAWSKTVNEFAGSVIYPVPGQPNKFDFNNKTTPPNFDNGGNFDLSTDEFTAP